MAEGHRPEYSQTPTRRIHSGSHSIESFTDVTRPENIDWETVESFGSEWHEFGQFSESEIAQIGADYFDIVPGERLDPNRTLALDVGCGSGRWSKFLATKVRCIEAVDPSEAVWVAARMVASHSNVRVTQAGVDCLPFADHTFDFVFSLGVLHHIPDTQRAIERCVAKLKPGGMFLIYLYYNLDNRGPAHKLVFAAVNSLRRRICKLSVRAKKLVCNLIAAGVYWPAANFAKLMTRWFPSSSWTRNLPLAYYRDKSFYIMRNDSLDRFGTPLEQRFSRREIEQMLINAGLENVRFSEKEPYWHAVATKLESPSNQQS
jgi:SAM-dependent methyltransferase